MPTIIRVKFRRDAHQDGQLVHAFSEDVDLDQLTPRARALAEALHDTMQHPAVGGTALDVRFESDKTNAVLADVPPRVPDAYRPVKDADQLGQRTTRWGPMLSAAADMTLVEWLESEARKIPLDWYPIGAPQRPRVPSWEAGAADRYLTREQVLEYMRDHNAEMSVTAWDTLRGTELLEPDRYVCRRPQWLPETIDAFIGRDRELWPLSRVAEYLGLTAGSARVQMRRWGFTAEGRAPGRGGESLYAADLIQAAHTHRPGRGARTDLRDAEEPAF
jgi:hypothetical protein